MTTAVININRCGKPKYEDYNMVKMEVMLQVFSMQKWPVKIRDMIKEMADDPGKQQKATREKEKPESPLCIPPSGHGPTYFHVLYSWAHLCLCR